MNFSKKFIKFIQKMSPDHHSQAAIFLIMIIIALVVHSIEMVVSASIYYAITITYFGRSFFQDTIKADKENGYLDMIVVLIGILGLVFYIFFIIKEII